MRTAGQWTLDELVDQVAGALASGSGYGGQASGRVRDLPDRRAVRYYTTLGLVDRPSGWRGRTALYGERHLLQLTAIKRLQALGLTLAEIQRELTARDDATLRRLAMLPAEARTVTADQADQAADQAAGLGEGPARARRRFWASAGDASSDASSDASLGHPAGALPPPPAPASQPAPPARVGASGPPGAGPPGAGPAGAGTLDGAVLRGVGLAPGVVLLVDAGWSLRGSLREADLAAVRAAAAPLLDTLARLGLRGHPGPSGVPSGPDGARSGPASSAPSPARGSTDPMEGDDR